MNWKFENNALIRHRKSKKSAVVFSRVLNSNNYLIFLEGTGYVVKSRMEIENQYEKMTAREIEEYQQTILWP
jgi:hypothetical protein